MCGPGRRTLQEDRQGSSAIRLAGVCSSAGPPHLPCKTNTRLSCLCRWKFPLYLSQDMNPANVNASGVQDVAAQARRFCVTRRRISGYTVQDMWCPAWCSSAEQQPLSNPVARSDCPSAAQHLDRLSFMQHLETEPPALEDKKEKPVYYRIANHYK